MTLNSIFIWRFVIYIISYLILYQNDFKEVFSMNIYLLRLSCTIPPLFGVGESARIGSAWSRDRSRSTDSEKFGEIWDLRLNRTSPVEPGSICSHQRVRSGGPLCGINHALLHQSMRSSICIYCYIKSFRAKQNYFVERMWEYKATDAYYLKWVKHFQSLSSGWVFRASSIIYFPAKIHKWRMCYTECVTVFI